jgi:cell division septal protein FtsQ
MGSSRASTSAGRRRTTSRRSGGTSASRRGSAAKHPPRKPAPKRTKPKPRKAPPKAKRPARKPRAPRSLKASAPRAIGIGVVVLALLGAGYQLWFRNSSFVAVEEVTVAGITGPEQKAVEAALIREAGEMTTLNVDEDALASATARFPTVVGVEADADFPNGLAISVEERPPVLLATAGDQTLPVAGDGSVLPGVDVKGEPLPAIEVDELPAQGRLTGDALEIAAVMGAAPEPLRELVEEVSIGGEEGVQVTLRGDVPLYFGGSDDAAAKWSAAAAVLADPKIDTLTYVDLRVAERPAVGGAAPPVTESTTETTEPETASTEVPAP